MASAAYKRFSTPPRPSGGGRTGGGRGGTRSYLTAPQVTAGQAQATTSLEPWLAAMRETQKRAAQDRARALAEIRSREMRAMAELSPWKSQIEALEAEPEVIGEAGEARLFETARVPIESGAQEAMRSMQEGFTPGGFRQARISGAREAKTGQLASIRSRIKLERMARKRTDILDVMRQRAQYGEAVAGIHERGGQTLAQLYGRTLTAVPAFG